MSKYSIFFLLAILGTMAAIAVPEAPTCRCVDERRFRKGPHVCGTDGITYESKRALKCHNKCHGTDVTVYSYERCPCRCSISHDYQPVCTSNGKWYSNDAAVDCHNQCYNKKIKIVSDELCNPDEKNQEINSSETR